MAKRPGGLTALAVLNFVFGGLGLLVNLIQLAFVDKILAEAGDQAPSAGTVYTVTLLGIASGSLLIAAGIGYLGQKKNLGQRVGAAYAAVALIGAFAKLVLMGEDFSIFTLFFMVYPLVTVFLIYTSFKDDFVR
jgi:hypothetical protein